MQEAEERTHENRTPTNGSGASSVGGEEAQAQGEAGEGIMDTVVLPVLDSVGARWVFWRVSMLTDAVARLQIHDRITNPAARASILKLRRAIEQAEYEVPGLMGVLISEIVDSVEVSWQ